MDEPEWIFAMFAVKVFLSIYDSALCTVKLSLLYFLFSVSVKNRNKWRAYSYMYIKGRPRYLSHGRQVTGKAFLRRGFISSFFYFMSFRKLSYPSVLQVSFQKLGT